LLSDTALATLTEIMCDEEILGSGDAETLSLLATLVHTCQMTRVLQIGTWIGFSSVVLAGALAHSKREGGSLLITIDPAVSQVEKAKSYVSQAGLSQYVQFVQGSSLQPTTVQKVRELGPYDLVFIHSDHSYATTCVELKSLWPLLKEGGLLAAHDASRESAIYDSRQEGGVFRAVSEWVNREQVEQCLLLTPPIWNPVGLFLAFKAPPEQMPDQTC
jgi:predicted O-methyltransferase YrrM